MASVAVILPAAGKSSRFGGREKKPFTSLDGRAVWLRTAELFVNRPDVKQVLLVISPEDREMVVSRFGATLMFMDITLVDGGAERFESVANALAKLRPGIDLVAVHDAVRPCTPPAVIDAVFAMAEQEGAALPGVAVADTLKRVDDTMAVRETVPRQGLWQAQTPQVFRRSWLEDAYARRSSLGAAITDDAQLVEAAGHPVRMVAGSPFNLKITTADDLRLAEMFLNKREAETAKKPSRPFDDDRFE
ncbi:2-C-methyl-D-erythritol 4-phosphate cytidylyltransferase [Zavarzinella formosa]|uniref:2-C-methyl-D-erythritol 4-phosphate cytidylyltransferase n=1 Tax=Zavarzinella formosa TaxID=360055 RepID=UPI00031E8080|nr:2-C-methyl-D-erythritol 4-phosphate cytidylyltransferase [Zavarzinella formosa]